MKKALIALGVAQTAMFAPSASAQVIFLDFEGLGTRAAINDFYNGGTDSQGNAGVNYGISFGANSLALRESDPLANFSREPSAETVMFFLTGSSVLNYGPGFDEGFSFFYSTVSFAAQVQVYDGLNATGNLLGTISLAALGAGPDLSNPFSNWEIGSLSFAGTARSIDFGGTVNQVGFDNITFGSVDPNQPTVPAIPEPSTYALMLAGLGVMTLIARRRRA
jgi:PEP-CTERM motif